MAKAVEWAPVEHGLPGEARTRYQGRALVVWSDGDGKRWWAAGLEDAPVHLNAKDAESAQAEVIRWLDEKAKKGQPKQQ